MSEVFFDAAAAKDKAAELAEVLGVAPAALRSMGVGRDESRSRWTFPECDGESAIIGIGTRASDGSKGFVRGGRRGLILPATLDLSPSGPTVLVVEGPSDMAAMLTLDLQAVGRPSATGGVKHLVDLLREMDDVLIIGDNDANGVGERAAEGVAQKLADAWSRPVRWSLSPDGCKDAREWLQSKVNDGLDLASDEERATAGGELLAVLNENARACEPAGAARAGSPVMRRIADVEPEVVCWLWPDHFARGKVNLIAGIQGLGKSMVTLDIAAHVSTAQPWPDSLPGLEKPAGVVLVSAEDGVADTIAPRLKAAGADLARCEVLDGVMRSDGLTDAITLADVAVLREAIGTTPECALLVIDPVGSYVGRSVDSYKDSDVRGLLAPLCALADETGVAIVLVAHLNKSSGAAAIHRVTGSTAWTAAVRVAWLVAADPDCSGDEDARVMVSLKNNLAHRPPGLGFTIIDGPDAPMIAWGDRPIEDTADNVLRRMSAQLTGDDGFLGRLLAWVKSPACNGEATARMAQRNFNALKGGVGLARDALDELVHRGDGSWRFRKSGTQTVEVFRAGGVGASLPPTDSTDTDTLPTDELETPEVSVSLPCGGKGGVTDTSDGIPF